MDLSPRARSFRFSGLLTARQTRPISACAELPMSFILSPHSLSTDLRVRGASEKLTVVGQILSDRSPRARSFLGKSQDRHASHRPISACAELPLRLSNKEFFALTDLRVRGASARVSHLRIAVFDRSPRARSFLCRSVGSMSIWRPISACAELPYLLRSSPRQHTTDLRVRGASPSAIVGGIFP